MDLTDEELDVVYDILYDEVYYGDDEFVYGDSPEANAARSALEKLNVEGKRRKLC